MIPQSQLDELSRLLKAATPGPVVERAAVIDDTPVDEYYREILAGCGYLRSKGKGKGYRMSGCISPADMGLFAAAVNALPSLLATAQEAARLRVALERLLRADERPPSCEQGEEAVEAMSQARAALAGVEGAK